LVFTHFWVVKRAINPSLNANKSSEIKIERKKRLLAVEMSFSSPTVHCESLLNGRGFADDR